MRIWFPAAVLSSVAAALGCLPSHSGLRSKVSSPLPAGVEYEKILNEVCAYRNDGRVVCWPDGMNDAFATADVPKERFLDIALYPGCGCGLRKDHSVVCWGPKRDEPESWYCRPPPGIKLKRLINTHGITMDGQLVYWNQDGVERGSARGGVADMSFSTELYCLQRATNKRWVCWGREAPGCMTPPDEALHGLGLGPASLAFACALTEEDHIRCWGYDRLDETGEEVEALDARLKQGIDYAEGAGVAQAVSEREERAAKDFAHRPRVLGIKADDLARTLQLARPVMFKSWVKDYGLLNPPPGKFTKVVTGYMHGCALREDGRIVCWGEDCGAGAAICDPPPWKFEDVFIGNRHALGVTEDGRLVCWGEDLGGTCTPP